MALGTPANEVQGTLSASFTRGTDTNIVLNSGEGANFPNSPQVVRLTDGDHWCLLKYSSVSTDTLVMASATDYALENNVSSGDETYTWPVGSAVELIMTADYLKELQDGTLHLDQTPPQTVINGVPLMEETPIGAADIKSLVNKEYVDLAVTSLGASYYMYDEDDATGYKTCYLDPSTDAETYLEKASLSDGDYIGGWISADGVAPAKLLKGVYNWYVMLEKTTGTQSLRVYWQLIERKSDNSETVIATSSDSNEISSKESYLVPLQLNSDYIPDSGSRIVGKLYAAVSGGGNAPTVRIYYQDATSSRWEIPASSEIFKNIFVPYSGATQNIDLGGRDVSNLGRLNFDAATELTISSGAITITQSLHTVDTEGDASTDDLDTINGGTPGDVLYLRAADGSRTVVLKHGTGNIVTPDGNDYSFDDANKVVQLIYGSDSKWHLVGSAGGGGSSTFTGLTDTPSSYTGYAGYSPVVDDDETNLIFARRLGVTIADTTIYVDASSGSDTTGDGSASAPYATIQKAIDWFRDNAPYILHDCVIAVGRGTYTPAATYDLFGLTIPGSLTIQGQDTSDNLLYTNGTAGGGGSNTITLESGTSWDTDFWVGAKIWIWNGTGAGQVREVSGSSNADPCVITVSSAWSTAPDSTSQYVIQLPKIDASGLANVFDFSGIHNLRFYGLAIISHSSLAFYCSNSSVNIEKCYMETSSGGGVKGFHGDYSLKYNYIYVSDVAVETSSLSMARIYSNVLTHYGAGGTIKQGVRTFSHTYIAMYNVSSLINRIEGWDTGIYASDGSLVGPNGTTQTFVNCTTNTAIAGSQSTDPAYIK